MYEFNTIDQMYTFVLSHAHMSNNTNKKIKLFLRHWSCFISSIESLLFPYFSSFSSFSGDMDM
jgi:hypothetical protein